MVADKTFFIIPGFKEKPSEKQYSWLEKLLRSKGFDVVRVPIAWDRRTMSDYVQDFMRVYEKEESEENYVLGFSYGAVIAFLSANIVRPKKIYLCSLSARFKEDIFAMKPWIRRYQGKRRIAESLKTRGREVAKDLRIPSVVFCGESEAKLYPQLYIRCKETAKLASKSKLVMVKDAPHRIDFPSYKDAIAKELQGNVFR